MANDDVCVGIIKGAFGVRGQVRVLPMTERPESMAAYGTLHTRTGVTNITAKLLRAIGHGHYVANLSCVKTREDAEELKGVKLYAPRSALPETEEDDFYYVDLIGLDVKQDGQVVGQIKSVQNFGASDLLEIKPLDTKKSYFLPFTRACVPVIDIPSRYVVVIPPEELE